MQHDKSLPRRADGQVKQFQDLKAKSPGAVPTVKRTAADRDLVAVHWHASATQANEATGEAKVDLYRVGNSKLVEQADPVRWRRGCSRHRRTGSVR